MGLPVKKAVITGGSSSIGVALIKKLLSENIEILALQRKDSVKRQRLPEHKLLHIEFCSLQEIKSYIPKQQDFDVFFHLAWVNTIKDQRYSIEAQMPNVAYTCDAAELAHKLGCKAFIGAGSQAEYGRHDEPLRPDTLCVPENAYGIMKLCANHASKLICNQYGMRHNWPRILSGYGLYDNTSSVLISTILKSMEGKKLEFSKGEQIWDFVHMDDIANAFFLIAEKGRDGVDYPIGSGQARPLRDYLMILCEKLGCRGDAVFGRIPYDKAQVMHMEADISRLYSDTGWEPQIPFERGIEEVIQFYR